MIRKYLQVWGMKLKMVFSSEISAQGAEMASWSLEGCHLYLGHP